MYIYIFCYFVFAILFLLFFFCVFNFFFLESVKLDVQSRFLIAPSPVPRTSASYLRWRALEGRQIPVKKRFVPGAFWQQLLSSISDRHIFQQATTRRCPVVCCHGIEVGVFYIRLYRGQGTLVFTVIRLYRGQWTPDCSVMVLKQAFLIYDFIGDRVWIL